MHNQTTAGRAVAQQPVVTWLLQTFEPETAPELLESDRYALVEQGLCENTVRYLDDAANAGDVLAEDIRNGYGITGNVRIFDLTASLEACELACAVHVDISPGPGHEPRELARPTIAALLPAQVTVSLAELQSDIETLNDTLSERVTGSSATLVGFAYRAVAVTAGGDIVLEVTGDVDLPDTGNEDLYFLRARTRGDGGGARFRTADGGLGDLEAAAAMTETELATTTVPDGFELVRLPAMAIDGGH